MLRRVSGVSDIYWLELYQPLIDAVERTLYILERPEFKNEFEANLKNVMVKCKGVTLSDSIYTHMYNYGASLSYTCIFLSNISSKYVFTSISTDKKTLGDRNEFLPWLKIPSKSTYKVSKRSGSASASVYCFSVLSIISPNNVWLWLYQNTEIHTALMDSLISLGQRGRFKEVLPVVESESNFLEVDSNTADENQTPSLDDILSGVQTEVKTVFDELNIQNADLSISDDNIETSVSTQKDDSDFDFSIFNKKETSDVEVNSTFDTNSANPVSDNNDDIGFDFSIFDKKEVDSNRNELNDFFNFAKNALRNNLSGFHLVKASGQTYLVVLCDIGLEAYIQSEYEQEDHSKAFASIKDNITVQSSCSFGTLTTTKGESDVYIWPHDLVDGVTLSDAVLNF